MTLSNLFVLLIYQPFFNILVFFYFILDKVTGGHPDMGIAVILLTILIRILLLPMSLSGDKSEKERRQIALEARGLDDVFAQDPIKLKEQKKILMRKNRGVIVGELISLGIQVAISLMLWRIFAEGLKGEDFHLLYPFMPRIEEPFNLVFLGKFHLDHTAVSRQGIDGSVMLLNLLQSFLIFVLETIAIYTSPYPPQKGEVVRLQLVLPLVSFFVFMFLPAGKKLFVITTLIFSIILVTYKYIRRRFEAYKLDQEQKEAALAEGMAGEEKVIVEVK